VELKKLNKQLLGRFTALLDVLVDPSPVPVGKEDPVGIDLCGNACVPAYVYLRVCWRVCWRVRGLVVESHPI